MSHLFQGANCFLLEDGQCINYGECGPGFNTQTVLNCPATDENRHGPIMNGTTGLAILKAVCPNLYKGMTIWDFPVKIGEI